MNIFRSSVSHFDNVPLQIILHPEHPPSSREQSILCMGAKKPSQIPPVPKSNRKGAHPFIASALKKEKGGEYRKTSKKQGNHRQFQREYLCGSHFSSPNTHLAIYQSTPRWMLPRIVVAKYMPRLNSANPRGKFRTSRDRS